MPAPAILVVDDQPINVQLLKRKLEREGIRVLAAYNGKEALDLVQSERPDLILLDVMMPDMDGIEVCQRLQAKEATRGIPVIFITARTGKESKLEGLGVGAVDYITKPIDLDETLARVQTQLRFVAINRQMVDLQRRLEEARRAATIGAVTQGIAHNLNNLLGVVIGYLDLVKAYYDKPDQVRKNAQHVEDAVQRIVAIIKQLSTLVVRSRPPLTKAGLEGLLSGGIARFHDDNKFAAPVTIDNALGDIGVETNFEVFEQVLAKVLMNAWESYHNRPEDPRPIAIQTHIIEKPEEGRFIEVRVIDHGHGIDPEIRDKMFEPFVSSKNTVGVGMGLTVARHALRNLGGEVTMADTPGGGATAILVHPLDRKARKNIQS
ncbi:response regulator [Opitutus sp. ER46]|uniref:hybrid sensor histidine kinase/response regulator n=1 Tax=Opitutus sp. ER46 TaxID=2161864 RepID=UPI000D2FA946|nr:response regulator [Opitutus sp. ER46]PTX92629.1 hybrid sensor histidine kinase/response regulator [Opitutus sp. ER46]